MCGFELLVPVIATHCSRRSVAIFQGHRCGCRYEAEENSSVCQSMERAAELFISGAAVPEIMEDEGDGHSDDDALHPEGHAAGAA